MHFSLNLRRLCGSALLPLVFCAVTGWAGGGGGAQVSEEEAMEAAYAWMNLSPTVMNEARGRVAGTAWEVTDSVGEPLYYAVDLAPKGYVVVAAEDGVEPVIAFSTTDKFEAKEGNPLFDMLQSDVPARIYRARAQRAGRTARWKTLLAIASTPKVLTAQGMVLTAGGAGGPAASIVDDVRVAPLLKSEWNQTTTNWGQSVYNYYTPPYSAGNANNYDAGCVATMLSQLMRYYQWPQTGVGTGSYQVTVKGKSEQRSLRGGDGNGGAYAWSDMPLVATQNMPAAQAQAIGALLSDAGVASNMDYEPDGSGATIRAQVLTNVFHYANAAQSTAELSTLDIAIDSNLDAKLPVGLGITGGGFGHAVVADGYGYNGSTLYRHLNMGWSGACNAWYNLPDVDAGGYDFNVVNSALFNIDPTTTGEVISGRVTDSAGKAAAGIAVAATSGTVVYTGTTDAEGIYAFKGVASNTKWTITPGSAAWNFTPADLVVTTGHSSAGGGMGDKTGVDFTSQPITGAVTVEINNAAAAAGAEWRVNEGSWQASGETVAGVPAGTGTLSFRAATDWTAPANMPVAITGSETTSETVSYSPKYSLTAAADNPANGQVTANPEPGELGSYAPNTSVTLTATPETGYYFGGWIESGTLISTDASYTSVVKGARSLVANFPPNSLSAEDTQAYVTSNKGDATINVLGNANDTETTPTVLSVTQPTNGTVTINGDGTLTFTPARNFHGSTTFSYTLGDGQGGTITRTATISNWFAASAGNYAGLSLAEDDTTNETSGYLKVTVTSSGAFSGKLTVAGIGYSLSGAFDSNADYEKVITRKDNSNLNVSLHLDAASEIVGTVGDGVTTSYITAERVVFSALNKAPQAGKYTALLSGNDSVPGNGYMIVTISSKGVATATGRLADGTPVTIGAYLNADGSMPYYAGIYKSATGAGSVLGTMDFQPDSSTQCSGSYAWFRPASTGSFYAEGFAEAGTVTGALVAGGASGPGLQNETAGSIEAELSQGDLAGPINETGNLESNGSVVWNSPGAENLVLTIKASGMVTGTFIDPNTGKKVTVLGVWLGNQQAGGGFFVSGNSAGALTLGIP